MRTCLVVVLSAVGLVRGIEAAPPAPNDLLDEVRDGLLADERNERLRQSQILQAEVEEAIRAARATVRETPEPVLAALKLQLDRVESAAGIDPAAKARLRGQLAAALQQAARQQVEADARRQDMLGRQASAVERRRRADAIERTEDKLRQILDRFGSLMNEGRYREAEELAAVHAAEQFAALASRTTPTAAEQWARQRNYLEQVLAIRDAAQRNYTDAMYQVEKSHVPFPDDPPLTYPDPQVWQELTLRRREYASIDLARRGSREEQILAELDNNTKLDFVETPLSEVLDYLEDLHNIPIEFDAKAIEAVGIGADTPVTRNLSGVSLRSALRLMLKDLDLTYLVRNEVLLITTQEEVDALLATKVYPVADLVLPISNGLGSNPFMLGGGLGGRGGFGGNMAGGAGMNGGMGQIGGMGNNGFGNGNGVGNNGFGNGFGNNGFGL